MIAPTVFYVMLAFGVQPVEPFIPAKAKAYYTLNACVKDARKVEAAAKKQVEEGFITAYFVDCIRVQI
jgi:hypothetical protein